MWPGCLAAAICGGAEADQWNQSDQSPYLMQPVGPERLNADLWWEINKTADEFRGSVRFKSILLVVWCHLVAQA